MEKIQGTSKKFHHKVEGALRIITSFLAHISLSLFTRSDLKRTNGGKMTRFQNQILRFWVCGFLTIGLSSISLALDMVKVLPHGVNSPAFKFGQISGLQQKYAADGKLYMLGDLRSIEFDSKELARIEPEAKELIDALNQLSGQGLGDDLHLGVLRVETSPTIKYFAPIYAYGVTPRWTLGFGLPVVQYENKIRLTQSPSNVAEVEEQVANASPRLREAFNRLNVGLVSHAQTELQKKGYKPLVDRRETLLGDAQLVSLYQVHAAAYFSALARSTAHLPTGPSDDADDLAALNAFGRTAIEQEILGAYQPLSYATFVAKAGYKYTLPDKVDRRVPESDADTLPSAERKENVNRSVGGATTLGLSTTWNIFSRMNAGVGYEWYFKSSDSYSGSRGYEYGRLSRDSESSAQRVRLGLEYNSTTAYQLKESSLPAIFSYEFIDTVSGTNIERQTIHELWLTLFF